MYEAYYFIAGAGQDKTAWDDVANTFSSEFTVHTFAPSDLTPAGTNFSIQVSADELNNYMDASGIRQAVLCGLSLGAMICTQFAIDHPEKALSLVLCGSQVHPNPFLMSLQSGIMKLFPEKLLGLPAGLTKRQLLDILRESAKVDFRNSLATIKIPTLIVCGANDKPNLPAAKYLVEHIEGAKLEIIPNAGHQVNLYNVNELQGAILNFLT